MKVKIPDSSKEFTLEQFQTLMGKLKTNKERGEYILQEFSGKDISLFDDDTKTSVFLTVMSLLNQEKHGEPPKEIQGYKHPSNLLQIRVGHLLEIVNADVDGESLERAEILMGCFYRKDWSKDFSEEEIVKTMEFFLKRPMVESFAGVFLIKELMQTLRDVYPLLHDEQIDREVDMPESEDEGRKMYSMLNGLTNHKATEWDKAKNMMLKDAYVFLEEKKKEYLKEKLAQKQRGY